MRKKNFFAGPSVLPVEVLEEIRDNIVDYKGQGLSMIEASHRGGMFEEMYDECLALFRELLSIPDNYDVYFLGGGATLQFTMIPMNFLLRGKCADYAKTGSWANKAASDAQKLGNVNVFFDDKANNYTHLPDAKSVKPSENSAYVYICANETIGGIEWKEFPDTGDVPLIADMSSDILSRLVEDFSMLPREAAIVSPRLLNADGSLQLCGRPPYPARNYLLQQWHLYSEPKDDTAGKTPVFGTVYETSNITGAAFVIRTAVFRELGFFDERYFFTPEDIALSTLARSKGYRVYVDSSLTIVHRWKATASAMSAAIRPSAVKGSLIFFGGDSRLKLLLLSAGVYAAESAKRFKAWLRLLLFPGSENALKHRTFRNICRSIFSPLSPKEIFIRYRSES